MGQRDEVIAVRDLRIGVDVAEVLDRHGLDPGGLQRLGDFDAGAARRVRRRVSGSDLHQPVVLVVGPGRDRDPSITELRAALALGRALAARGGTAARSLSLPARSRATTVAWYSSSHGERE